MATASTMLALGTACPDFSLPEVGDGRLISRDDFVGAPALLIIFLCTHCPYVVHVREELARLDRDYTTRGVAIVGITANDSEAYPEDAAGPTAAMARESGWAFPVLYDETQAVARAFTAACTPDFFLFDAARHLVYRGQLDDSRPSRGPDRPGQGVCDGRSLRRALDATLAGGLPDPAQFPSLGCNIKWKPGLEPDYF